MRKILRARPRSSGLSPPALSLCFTVLLALSGIWLFLVLSQRFGSFNVYEQIELGLLLWAVGSVLTWAGTSSLTRSLSFDFP